MASLHRKRFAYMSYRIERAAVRSPIGSKVLEKVGFVEEIGGLSSLVGGGRRSLRISLV